MVKTLSKVEQKLYHYLGKAIADYNMIQPGDKVMLCLSGGKDSYSLLKLMQIARRESKYKFELFSYTLDQSQPGWDDGDMRAWLDAQGVAYEIETRDTYSIVKEKIPAHKTYCSLCSRLRRGNIYRYARDNGFDKIALGHHREDAITSLLMSILYNGSIQSMPPKLLSDDKQNTIIRPMIYCQERDIIQYAKEQQYPIIPCNLCGTQENLMRVKVKKLIQQLAEANPKVPSNILAALQNIRPSQLMDKKLWDFAGGGKSP